MSTEWSGGNQGSRIEIRKPQSPVRSEIRNWISPALLCTTFVRWDTSIIEKRGVEGGKAKEEGLRVRCEFVCGPSGTATSLATPRPAVRRSIDLSAPAAKWSSSGVLHGDELPLMDAGQGALLLMLGAGPVRTRLRRRH